MKRRWMIITTIVSLVVILSILSAIYPSLFSQLYPFSVSSGSFGTTSIQIPDSSTQVGTDSPPGVRLELQLSTYSKYVAISADELNLFNATNKVTASNRWQYPAASLNPFNPCGDAHTLGLAIFQGSYGLNDLGAGQPLALYNTSLVFSCSTEPAPIVSYAFHPLSSMADGYHSQGSSFDNQSISLYIPDINGYWTAGSSFSGPSVFRLFPPGTYTVIAADEWGRVALLHFVVVEQG